MAEKDPGTPDESSLELPSFGLRRRKRKRDSTTEAAPEPEAVPASEPEPEQVPEATAEVADPAAPATDDTIVLPVPTQDADEPTVVLEGSSAGVAPPPAPRPGEPAGATPGAPEEPSATPPISALDTLFAPDTAPEEETVLPEQRTAATEPTATDEDVAGREGRDYPRFVLPALGAMAAAVVTGLLIGLAMVVLTALSMRGCEAVNGTSSCGTPGLMLLLAILIVLVYAGAALLRAWDVSDPGSTSFLAIAITTVIALLFLIDVLFDRWMVIVIPLVSALSFALSRWVATTFTEPTDA